MTDPPRDPWVAEREAQKPLVTVAEARLTFLRSLIGELIAEATDAFAAHITVTRRFANPDAWQFDGLREEGATFWLASEDIYHTVPWTFIVEPDAEKLRAEHELGLWLMAEQEWNARRALDEQNRLRAVQKARENLDASDLRDRVLGLLRETDLASDERVRLTDKILEATSIAVSK